jgi:para-aminobenzoate synthetase component 1
MRIPRRHSFRLDVPADVLFRRLPRGARFRFSPAGEADVFGAEPEATLRTDDGLALDELRRRLPRVPPIRSPRFGGGAVAVLPYEAGLALEELPRRGPAGAWYGIYDTFATAGPDGTVEVVSWGLGRDGTFDEREALRRARDLEERLRDGEAESTWTPSDPARLLSGSLDEAAHGEGVRRILEHIRDGDIYQANLTARFDVRTDADPLALFERLRRDNPAPFAAYVETDDGVVISSSPERMLRARGRELETRPIKGTAARSPDPAEDARRARALADSAKDRAELVMITDLARNDLGKVCVPGSIRVPKLREVESFAHVHHLVSTVTGTLRPGADPLDALAAMFPFGSITGAPKRRAMQILSEREPVPRGVYTGAGWIGFDRDLDLSVAIRTGLLRDNVFSFGSGGGIVADSQPDAEWRELLVKARAFALALDVDLEPAATGRRS